MNYWFEVAIISTLTSIGNIVMGHFEEGASKWKRVIKIFIFMGLSILISATAGRVWFFVFLGTMLSIVLGIHLWWLPKHGVNGWTAEPKEKYYELRGWKRQ